MRVLTEPLKELECFNRAEAVLSKKGTSVLVSGCVDSQKWNLAWGLGEKFHDRVIVTYSDQRIREIYEDLKIYDKNVHAFPAKDVIFYEADVHSNKLTRDRLICIKRIMSGLPCTMVTTFSGLMNAGADYNLLKNNILKIELGEEIDVRTLSGKLVAMGYEKTYQVETGGQFSVRGGIVDIFDLTDDNPVRIEFWGDEVTSLRSFDVESQRSIERLDCINIFPATELPLSEDALLQGLAKIEKDAKKLSDKFRMEMNPECAHRLDVAVKEVRETITEFPWSFNADSYIHYFVPEIMSFADYFEDVLFVVDEPARTAEHAGGVELEFKESMKMRLEKGYIVPGQADVLFSKSQIIAKLKKQNLLLLSTMDGKTNDFPADEKSFVAARSIPSYNNDFMSLIKDLESYHKRNYRVLILSGSRTRAERLAGNINENDVTAFFGDKRDRCLAPGEIETMYGYVVRGFEYPEIKFVVISEGDIFGSEKKK
ncbi:MAG: transcription-repair coupling factor, partial [Lachnospiraceae bacterium]|nr:transcription-repair coupling factor [Lachnospiraceae bacterium]